MSEMVSNGRRLRRTLLLVGVSAGVLAAEMLLAAPALASESSDVSNANGSGVGEIVVTARRRDENIQDVPATVVAVSAADMDRTPTTSLNELQTIVPGLTFAEPQFDKAQIYLRGIGSNQFSAGSEGSVGVFVDGVYLARFSMMNVPLLDVRRVEVLKGPQGALYGRNTIGGAINVITAEPTKDLSGQAEVTYGRFKQLELSAALSGPLTDTLGFRISGSKVRDGGFMHILNMNGRVTGNGDDYVSTRAKLLWEPTSQVKVELSGDYMNRHAQGEVDHLTNVGGLRGSPYLMLGPDLPTTLQNSYYSNNIYDARVNFLGRQDNEGAGGALKVSYKGSALDITATTSYRWNRYTGNNDYDSTEFDVINTPKAESARQFSQEIRFTSTPGGFLTGNGRINWSAGFNYFQENVDRSDTLDFRTENLFAVLLNGGVPYSDTLAFTLKTKSYSFFGQLGIDLTPRLNLTLGGRYTIDDKIGIHRPTTTNPNPGGFVRADFVQEVRPPSYRSFDPSASLHYKVTDDIGVYASYTRGSKSGAFQFTVPLPQYATVALMAKPESVDAYEIGLKSTFLDRKLLVNLAAFYMDYKDLQVQKRVQVDPANPASAATLLSNAEKSRIKGFEADIQVRPSDRFSLDFDYQYLDAKFVTFIFDATHDFSGNVMPRSPKHSLTARASYTVPVAGGDLTFYGGYQWMSAQFLEPDNSDPGTRQAPYGLLSTSATLNKGPFRFSLWAENLTNSKYIVADVSNPPNPVDGTGKPAALAVVPGRPRTYGITVGVKF